METAPAAVASVDAPTWLQWSPNGRLLYAASEVDEGRIVTFAVVGETLGEVRLELVGCVSTGGSGPCHFAFVAGGSSHLVVAHYRDGTVSTLEVDAHGGLGDVVQKLRHEGSGPDPARQASSHPHMVVPCLLFIGVSVVDLGTDQIRSYRLNDEGLIEHGVSALPAGTGPRQLVRVPGTDVAWLAGELSGTVLRLRENVPGRFSVTGE